MRIPNYDSTRLKDLEKETRVISKGRSFKTESGGTINKRSE